MNDSILLHRLNARTIEDPSTGCWEWQGAIGSGTGYGKVRVKGKAVDTHRAAWMLANGPIEPGMDVCHTCDNRACLRLSHLFIGTRGDNMRDARDKGRMVIPAPSRGVEQAHAKLTDDLVREIYMIATTTDTRHIDIAAAYGISRQRVGKIRHRQIWRHVFEDVAA